MKFIALFLRILLTNDGDLLQILLDLIMHILACTEEEAMDIVSQMLAQYEDEMEWVDELMEIDAAVAVLTRDDQDHS